MPTKPYAFAGTVPEEHGLDVIRSELLAHPRRRHLVVAEVTNMHTGIDHPDYEPDARTVTLRIREVAAIVAPDDIDAVRRARDRAMLEVPGQGTLDQEMERQTGDPT